MHGIAACYQDMRKEMQMSHGIGTHVCDLGARFMAKGQDHDLGLQETPGNALAGDARRKSRSDDGKGAVYGLYFQTAMS